MEPLAAVFQSTFEEQVLPRLKQLGLERTKVKKTKPGLIVAAATRALGAQRTLNATLWCDAKTGSNLRFRVDVLELVNDVELTRQLELKVPWPDPAYPKLHTLDFSGKDFRPHESLERLARAISFLGCGFAASVMMINEPPELQPELQVAAATPEWKAAVVRAKELWDARFA